ncbi:MAG: transporter substrate-binding domain-containing protein [Betaproteobacteria bacterium]|nr:transporter substrate-binding domain-containing protein [Betaproteobacteria bacterium]
MLTLACLGLCAAVQAQSNDTLKKIADSGKMVVAYRESSVPFSYLDGVKPIGFSEELTAQVVKAVQEKIGKIVTVEHQAVTSANRIPLLQNGTIDLECGSTTNNSLRGKDVTFAINHFYTGTRLVVKKSSKIKKYADLKGKTVASTTGTTNVVVLRKYNQENKLDMNLVMGKDHSDSFLLVEQDRAVAFGMDDILLFGLVANAKNPADFEVVGDSLQVEPYACMLRKDDPAFKQLVDNTFKDLMKSGAFEKMYNKWFMSPIPPKGMNLNLPMAKELRDNLKAMSDKPAT